MEIDMTIKHMIILNDYNKFVFDDATVAMEAYRILSSAKSVITNYEKGENGEIDYGKPITTLETIKISLTLYKPC